MIRNIVLMIYQGIQLLRTHIWSALCGGTGGCSCGPTVVIIVGYYPPLCSIISRCLTLIIHYCTTVWTDYLINFDSSDPFGAIVAGPMIVWIILSRIPTEPRSSAPVLHFFGPFPSHQHPQHDHSLKAMMHFPPQSIAHFGALTYVFSLNPS